jgi:hypothetical protein
VETLLRATNHQLRGTQCRRPTTVSFHYTQLGERVRVSDRTGRIIPKPPWERRDWKERSALKGMNKSGSIWFLLSPLCVSMFLTIGLFCSLYEVVFAGK